MDDAPAPPWTWNKANVQSVGGGFLVDDFADVGLDTRASNLRLGALRFYVGARTGADQMLGNASTGVATLRRDGFASMGSSSGAPDSHTQPSTSATPVVVRTHPLVFSGHFLFVNVDAEGPDASVVVAISKSSYTGKTASHLCRNDTRWDGWRKTCQPAPIEPFTVEASIPIVSNTTRTLVTWRVGGQIIDSMAAVAGQVVSLHFVLYGGARLYSFWVSPSRCGESRGYVAAGGRGFDGPTDVRGGCGVIRELV